MITNDEVLPALLRRSFPLFLRFAYREISGGDSLMWNFHIDAIIHQLELVRSGQNRRLIVAIPPRHLKSVIMTAWVAWMLGNDSSLKFICASYGYDLAEKHARLCLRIIMSSWFQAAFPNLRLTARSVLNFETDADGYRLSTSVGGVVTGIGADFVIIDDPMKADDAQSEAARQAVKNWFDETLRFRLESLEHGSIVVVMQRLHEADLAGELLSRGGWRELRLPAIAPDDELIEVAHGRFYQRRQGHALHPERQSLGVLEELRAENAHAFAAQQQQDPVPITGNFVDPAWLRFYDEAPKCGLVVQSWDTASKTGLFNDYSVGITARIYQRRFYVLDVHRERMDFGKLRERVCELCRRHRVERLLIEDAASGQQLLQMLRPPPAGLPYPIACTPDAEKIVRFHAQASKIQAGELVLPRTAPWLPTYISEIAAFPNGRFDDQADATAQLLRHGEPPYQNLPSPGPILIDADDPAWVEVDPDFDPWAPG